MFLIELTSGNMVDEFVLRSKFPNTSFPMELTDSSLESFGYAVLHPSERPPISRWQRHHLSGYDIIDGKHYERWQVNDLAEFEVINNCLAIAKGITQRHLDQFANTRGYDSILSACSYVTSSNAKFAAEANRCVFLRDLAWSVYFDIEDKVRNEGFRPESDDEIEVLMPLLTWE